MGKVRVALVLLIVGALTAQSLRPLTAAQVDQLIGVLPDTTLAREIRQRGTAFKVDRAALQHFREVGAGTETMASLAELLSNAQLVVASTPPNCDISLNGHPVGKTDDTGKLAISDLDAGLGAVVISKDGYRSRRYDVGLSRNKTAELSATLERATGHLSVSVIPQEAAIVVRPKSAPTGAGMAAACVSSPSGKNVWECVPGEYTITAALAGFVPSSEGVWVLDGETTRASLNLPPEPRVTPAPTPSKEIAPPPSAASIRFADARGTEDGVLRLLAAAQNAMGGKERLAGIRDWQQRATDTWEPGKGTTETTISFAAPSSIREESKGGNRTANYSDGSTGWTWSSTHQVARDLPTATTTGMSFRVLNTLLLNDDKERSIRLVGSDGILFSDKYNNSATLTVDVSNHLPKKLAWRNLDGAILEETYSDWRRIGDVMWWFQMSRARDGATFLQVRVRDYRINKGLTDKELRVPPGTAGRSPQQAGVSGHRPVELATSGEGAAQALLAGRYLQSNQFDDFEKAAAEALEAGAKVTFTLQHHHAMENLHPVEVSVSRESLAFKVVAGGLTAKTSQLTPEQRADSPPTSCRLDRFSSKTQGLISAEVTRNKADELFLVLKLNDGGSANEVRFADRLSTKRKWISKGGLGIGVVRRTVVSRSEAEQELSAIKRTIERAKALSEKI